MLVQSPLFRPVCGFGETGKQKMERLEPPYKGFQIRAFQEWSGQWLAEARKPVMGIETDWISTPSGHPTPESAIAFIKQMIEDATPQPTRRESEEIIETLYGINPKTFEVETVSLNRSGELRKRGKGGEPHHVARGRDPKSEVRTAFGLTNVFSVPEALVDQESTKRRVEGLRERAAEMKRTRSE